MRLVFILLFSTCFNSLFAQEFAPIGAKWRYCLSYFEPPSSLLDEIEVISDTIVNEDLIKIIQRTLILKQDDPFRMDTTIETKYLKVIEDSIFYSNSLEDFQFIYKKNAYVGDSFPVQEPLRFISIDSIKTISLNNYFEYKLFFASQEDQYGWGINTVVSDFFGPLEDGFNMPNSISIIDWTPFVLIEYEDSNFGRLYFNEWERACDDLTNTSDLSSNNKYINVFPNPSTGNVSLEFGSFEKDRSGVIYDCSGRKIFEVELNQIIEEIYINKSGLYFLKIKSNFDYSPLKIVIQL